MAAVIIPQRKRTKKMQKDFSEIKVGMTREELITLLGQPTSSGATDDGKTILKWEHNEFKGLAAGGNVKRKITVELKDKKVVAFSGDELNV